MGRVEKVLFAWLVAMLVGVTATAGYVVVEHVTRCDRFHFRASEWRHPHGHRGAIADRLIECHNLKGLQAATVRERLGKPMSRSRPSKRTGTVVWSYDAGTYEGFFFGGSRFLDVEFTPGHVVRRVRLSYLSD
jgi:hypothetical protein